MRIQWFPGHIKKARDEIREKIKSVDIVINIIDSRAPRATIDPFLIDISKDKKLLIIANKSDLVDKDGIASLKKAIENITKDYILLDSRNNNITATIDKKIDLLLAEKKEKYDKKGINSFSFKAIVVGLPNVGKSTFINSYVKKKVNKVSDKAGVTRDVSLTKVNSHLLLYDTPGVTMPKFEDEKLGEEVAMIGSINDDIIDKGELSLILIKYLCKYYFNDLANRYKLDPDIKKYDLSDNNIDNIYINILDDIAKNTGCILKGAKVDYDRVSNLIIDDFRKGKIGKIYLEKDYD